MKDAEPKNTTPDIEGWENELWSLIKAGDGLRCPYSDSCRLIKEEVGCFNNVIEKEKTREIHRFMDKDDLDFPRVRTTFPRFSKCN